MVHLRTQLARAAAQLTACLPSSAVSPVNDGKPLLLSPRLRLDPLPLVLAVGKGLADGLVGEAHDLRLGDGVFEGVELGGVFLADDLVGGEVGEEEGGDEGLAGVVGDWFKGWESDRGATRRGEEGRGKGREEERCARTGDGTLVLLGDASAADELLLHLLGEEGSFEDGRDGDGLLTSVHGRRE